MSPQKIDEKRTDLEKVRAWIGGIAVEPRDKKFDNKRERHHRRSEVDPYGLRSAAKDDLFPLELHPARGRSYSLERLYSTSPYNQPRPRASSVASNASSRNNSLRGSHMFEQDYKTPEFVRPRSGSGSDYGIRRSSPALPPTPTYRASSCSIYFDRQPSSNNRYDSASPPRRSNTREHRASADDIIYAKSAMTKDRIVKHDRTPPRRPAIREDRTGNVYIRHVKPKRATTVDYDSNEDRQCRNKHQSLHHDSCSPNVEKYRLKGSKVEHGSQGEIRSVNVENWKPENSRDLDKPHGQSPKQQPMNQSKEAIQGENRMRETPPAPILSQIGAREIRSHSRVVSVTDVQNKVTRTDVLHQAEHLGPNSDTSNDERYEHSATQISHDSDEVPPSPQEVLELVDVDHDADMRECYICGEGIKLGRKRDWQEHVLQDIRPYRCLEEDCSTGNTTYGRLRDLRRHYRREHISAPIFLNKAISCLFCNETMEPGISSRFTHIARHLEEVALAIVPQQYEDWEFYSDTSAGTQLSEQKPTSKEKIGGDIKKNAAKQPPSQVWSQLSQFILPEEIENAYKQNGSSSVEERAVPSALKHRRLDLEAKAAAHETLNEHAEVPLHRDSASSGVGPYSLERTIGIQVQEVRLTGTATSSRVGKHTRNDSGAHRPGKLIVDDNSLLPSQRRSPRRKKEHKSKYASDSRKVQFVKGWDPRTWF